MKRSITILFSFLIINNSHSQIFIRSDSYSKRISSISRENIQNLIKKNSIISIEDFLKEISQSKDPDYQDLRRNYSLMFSSQSIQKGSFENPRAIMFTEDARTVMTFNGHKDMPGGNAIEIMQFNEEESAFEFFEIDFGKKPPMISQINPPKCLKCHGKDPRPIWEPYHFWSGAYGADDDEVNSKVDFLKFLVEKYTDLDFGTFAKGVSKSKIEKLIQQIRPKINKEFPREVNVYENKNAIDNPETLLRYDKLWTSKETQEYIQFVLNTKSHPRYRYLDSNRFDMSKQIVLQNRPNLILSKKFAIHNTKRIVRKLIKLIEANSPFRFAILGMVFCSGGSIEWSKEHKEAYIRSSNNYQTPEQFVPQEIMNKTGVTPFEMAVSDQYLRNQQAKKDMKRHQNKTGEDPRKLFRSSSNYGLQIPVDFSFLKYVSALAGIKIDDFGLNFNGPLHQIDGGIDSLFRKESIPLLKKWLSKDQINKINLEKLARRDFQEKESLCQLLSKESLNALNSRVSNDEDCVNCVKKSLPLFKEIKNLMQKIDVKKVFTKFAGSQTISKCISCHDYDDIDLLNEELRKNPNLAQDIIRRVSASQNEEYKMPPKGPRLTKKEIEDLKNYLSSVTKSIPKK